MAYAALISLKQTINGLLDSCSTREILEFAYDQTTLLQKVVERFNDSSGRCGERLYGLEGEIRDSAHQLEDALELNESEEMISSFAQVVKKMEVDYIDELSKLAAVAAAVSSHTDFGVEMVGHSAILESIRALLPRRMRPYDLWFFSILGDVGSGRTAAAKGFFDDQREQFFDCGAWVTVGRSYETEEVLMRILSYLDLHAHYEMLGSGKIELDVRSYLNEILEARRCLIVLDDVHDEELIYEMLKSCPDHGNGSLIMFTTSSYEVSRISDMSWVFQKPGHFFQEIMARCLSDMVGDSMSSELVEYGKGISENCPRARYTIAKLLLFLYKTEKTPEQWSRLAADRDNPVFMVGDDEVSEQLKIKREIQSFVDDGRQDDAIIQFVANVVDIGEYIDDIKMLVQPERYLCKMQIVSLFGMAGIGKTTCVRKIYNDESIMCYFDHCVWVNIGPHYQSEEILIDILAQIYPSIDKEKLVKGDEARGLFPELASKKLLIVLDDLWSKDPLVYLKNAFPDIKGTTLVTTRLVKVAKFGRDDTCYEIKLLDDEESWCLFCEKVFSQGLCPPELEEVGRKIVEKCEGLPLLILTVADQLLKVEISVEYWNRVASGKQKSVFKNAHREISKALLPSYERLPQHLKACFLYISAFRNEYKIPTSKLINLWIVERFVESNSPRILEDIASEYLLELLDNSIVMVQRKFSGYEIKTCRLHPVYWHLCDSVAARVKLFYAMNSYGDCSTESMKCQRRLCIRNSVLLGIKDVYDAVGSSSKSRSLLCTSPPHQYPVPVNFGFRLMRVLDVVAIRFYEFPVEVVDLFHLRYLGLTCNGGLPNSISKLRKLQHLIVNRYINSVSLENCSPLPVEIWDMKELKHLQVMGGILPNPKCGGGLPNLATLLDVRAESCTKKVLKRIPNLKRLGIQIELAPDERSNPFCYLNRISRLRRLESLKCAVVNPHIRSNVVAPPAPLSMFPSGLKELSLSGFGYPWEYMSTIGRLENLEVLKLKRYAFRGPRWEMMDITAFSKLKFLLVEDTDLVRWEGNLSNLEKVERVSIKHCYKLQEISNVLYYFSLTKLEIVDCNPSAMRWAEKVRDMLKITGKCEVKVHASFMD